MLRVGVIASPDKELAPRAMQRLAWLDGRCEVVFSDVSYDASHALVTKPDLLFVLGGDGTLISVAHSLGENQLRIVGVNLGKLGFLAEFTIEQLEREGAFLFGADVPVTCRVMLNVRIEHAEGPSFETPAVNDCVIHAGPPYRMIELIVEADSEEVATIRGDGLIIATPSGSTAHNLAAGGPILEPTAESFILTPICPHALTFRPLAMDSHRRIVVRPARSNESTTVSVDGHTRRVIQRHDRVIITRYPADFLLVRNPKRSAWSALRKKLMWGARPRSGD